MTGDTAFTVRAERIAAEHEARALAELAHAEEQAPGSDVVGWSGAAIAEVALVKGFAGPAESAGGKAMSGADGPAAGKALEALGWPADAVFATLSRPEPSIDPASRARRLRAQIEAVDPLAVIALDAEAAGDVAAAFGVDALGFGVRVRAGGRWLVAVDGFEASLADDTRKRRVWKQLQAARPEGPVY